LLHACSMMTDNTPNRKSEKITGRKKSLLKKVPKFEMLSGADVMLINFAYFDGISTSVVTNTNRYKIASLKNYKRFVVVEFGGRSKVYYIRNSASEELDSLWDLSIGFIYTGEYVL